MQNLLKRQSSRAQSNRSAKSTRSNRSNRSAISLRSQHQRVLPEELDELVQHDPDFADYARNFPSQTINFPLAAATPLTAPENYLPPPHPHVTSAVSSAAVSAGVGGSNGVGAPAITSQIGNKYSGEHESSSWDAVVALAMIYSRLSVFPFLVFFSLALFYHVYPKSILSIHLSSTSSAYFLWFSFYWHWRALPVFNTFLSRELPSLPSQHFTAFGWIFGETFFPLRFNVPW